MLYPSINELMKKVDSRYTLVAITAKRARVLAEGEEPLTEMNADKFVSMAVQEISQDKIIYTKNRS